ncbi:hypothetical protein EB118_06350 [bacterium]|nr:hypothetical protein [bacterium]NDC94377.1 hypothetical protein [bacterium]NDD83919.1 hypothetical protein [bacterium]NDG29699.1 hypothetical protein [bacterium]
MSFIAKSVNFSQTDFLKANFLAKAAETYNKAYSGERERPVKEHTTFFVPNNNNKYYLFVINKSLIEQRGSAFDILYFFPSSYLCTSPVASVPVNVASDFYIETESVFSGSDGGLLLEGYLYIGADGKQTMMLTDFLVRGDTVVDLDYPLRHTLLVELIRNVGILNNHTKITVHPFVSSENDTLMSVIKNNFVFCDQLVCTEVITDGYKKSLQLEMPIEPVEINQIIVKEKYPDTYSVLDKYGLKCGILYIKGISESRYMRGIMQFQQRTIVPCKFNNTFRKWQPVLNS